MVDVLCREPRVWDVLCAGLINSLQGFWAWRMGHAGGGERSEGGSSGPWLREVKPGGGWVSSWSNDMEIRWIGIESLGGKLCLPLMERRPSQVAPSSSKQPLILVQWMEPRARSRGAGFQSPVCHSSPHEENLHLSISRLQLLHKWGVVKNNL